MRCAWERSTGGVGNFSGRAHQPWMSRGQSRVRVADDLVSSTLFEYLLTYFVSKLAIFVCVSRTPVVRGSLEI